jgi:hypothetical protein
MLGAMTMAFLHWVQHVATLDDPACKLEVMLGSFGQRTHIIEIKDTTDIKPTFCSVGVVNY